jgi:hypothetical protein
MPQTLIERHFERLKGRCPEATLINLPSGAGLVTIPHQPLPAGWSVAEATLRFIAPNGYAVAAPDCLWVEPNLTLNGGGLPKNSQVQNQIPETQIVAHWFSWHVAQGTWCANRHDLLAWYGLCRDRLDILE